MKRRYVIYAVLATSVCCASAQSLTWKEAMGQIEHNNVGLQQLVKENESQNVSNFGETTVLKPTDVEFEHLWGADHSHKWNVGVSQNFDWPGLYGSRKDAARAWSRAYEYLYLSERNELHYKAISAFNDLTYCNMQLELLQTVLEKMLKLQEYVNIGYQQGQLTILDVKKLDLEVYSLESEISDARQQYDRCMADIAALNGGAQMDVDCSAYAMQPLYDKETYLQYAEQTPAAQALKAKAEATQADAKALRASQNPGFSIGYVHAFEENTHFNGLSVGIELPFFSRNKSSQAARMLTDALLLEGKQSLIANQLDVTADYDNAVRRRGQLDGLRKVTLDNNYPELLLMAYKGGQINVLTYIQETTYFLQARKDYLTAEYEYYSTLTRLNRYNPTAE